MQDGLTVPIMHAIVQLIEETEKTLVLVVKQFHANTIFRIPCKKCQTTLLRYRRKHPSQRIRSFSRLNHQLWNFEVALAERGQKRFHNLRVEVNSQAFLDNLFR